MATAPSPTTIDLTQVTTAHLNIRAARAEAKRLFEAKDDELKAAQVKLEGVMLGHLNAHGMESVRTDGGTFYRQEEVKPSASDWNLVYAWMAENNAFEMLEKRLTKTFIVDFMKAHDGALPPGVSVHREHVIRVRKPA